MPDISNLRLLIVVTVQFVAIGVYMDWMQSDVTDIRMMVSEISEGECS